MAFKEESASFAVGHMALAYLLGKSSAKLLKVNLNIPLILVLSILPDADILLEPLGVSGMHRGPTHSLISALIVFIPFFALYRRKAVPYFLALISHSLISDFLIGGQIMLFWPLTSSFFELPIYIYIWSIVNITLEWTLFAVSTIVMFKTGDLSLFFHNKKSNLLLVIPIGTVLLPTFVSYPLQVPLLLMPPHLFYLVLFSISVLTVIAGFIRKGGSSAEHIGSEDFASKQNLVPINPYTRSQ